MTEQAQVYLFSGYKPDFTRKAEKLARSVAKPVDIWRLGPGLRMADVSAVREFARIMPADSESTARVAVLSLDGARREVLTALLTFAEEPPTSCVLVLLAAVSQNLPQTLVSRCIHERVPVPKYGQLLVDLTRQGVEMGSAAKLAVALQRGYTAIEQIPSDTSISTAEALIAAGLSGDFEQGVRLTSQFDWLAVAALRERLANKTLYSKIPASYRGVDPKGIAMMVFSALLGSRRE